MVWFDQSQAVHPAWPARPIGRIASQAFAAEATNASTGGATGTGTANQPSVKVSPPAAIATGAGSVPGGAPPVGFTHVTITRDYDLADGVAPTGTVQFTPSAWLVNDGVVIPAATVAAPLDTYGNISISLAANTDPATAPPGSHYTVREDIAGQAARTYRITVPHNQGLLIDLSTLT